MCTHAAAKNTPLLRLFIIVATGRRHTGSAAHIWQMAE